MAHVYFAMKSLVLWARILYTYEFFGYCWKHVEVYNKNGNINEGSGSFSDSIEP
jgi:hypothetical protein